MTKTIEFGGAILLFHLSSTYNSRQQMHVSENGPYFVAMAGQKNGPYFVAMAGYSSIMLR